MFNLEETNGKKHKQHMEKFSLGLGPHSTEGPSLSSDGPHSIHSNPGFYWNVTNDTCYCYGH